jgi:hypothetical protein
MDYQSAVPVTMCLSKVTLAAGTTSTLSTTGTTTYAIRGKAYTKAALSNVVTPTTDWATGKAFLPCPASSGTVYMIGLDSGGTVRAVQGTVVSTDGVAQSATAFNNGAPQFGGDGPAGSGSTDNDFCPIGYIIFKADSTASSSPGAVLGSANLATPATGMSYSFVDVITQPDRPQIA